MGHSFNLVFLMAKGVNLMDKQIYSSADIKAATERCRYSGYYL